MTGVAQVTGKGHFRLFCTMTTFIWTEEKYEINMPVGEAERSKHIRERQVVIIKECIIPNFAFLCSFFSSSTNCSN